jgi:anti-sigma regulatory factor (Ser/Thr protein kinase)
VSRVQRDIETGAKAPAEARDVVDALAVDVPEPVLDDVRLVTSELVTNSVKHAGNPPGHPITVTLDLGPDLLRLEVVDRSVFDPTPETSPELRDVKWGLVIVDRIADSWGRIDPPEGGVWVEFRLRSLD